MTLVIVGLNLMTTRLGLDGSVAYGLSWHAVESVGGVAGRPLPWSSEPPVGPCMIWNWPWTAKEAEEEGERVE